MPKSSVAEPEEPKLFGDLEQEPKINLNKTFSAVSLEDSMINRKAYFYLYRISIVLLL